LVGAFFINSLKYAVLTAIGAVLSASVVAYGFARIHWLGREPLFYICLRTLMMG